MDSILPNQWGFSYFRAPVRQVVPYASVNLWRVFRGVKSQYFSTATERIRAESDSKARKNLKANTLDFCCFGCIVDRRHTSAVCSVSGLMVLDFDHVVRPDDSGFVDPSAVFSVLSALVRQYQALFAFRSPSGDGVKLVINVAGEWESRAGLRRGALLVGDAERRAAADAYGAIFDDIRDAVTCDGYDLDKSGRDLVRACYLCHDDFAFIDYTLLP